MNLASVSYWGIMALAVLIRGGHLLTPGLDSDQAITGLMARHILRGEFPVFFWGQDYAGALEAYLAAPLFYLLGASRTSLNLVPAILSLVLLPLVYRLGALTFGRAAGLLGMLFVAVSSPYVIYHYVLARAYYIENLLLGTVILLLTHLILFRSSGVARWRRLLILGFVIGLGFYMSFQIVHYALVAVLFLLLWDKRLVLRPAFWGAAAAFMAGSLPFWAYNLANRFESFGVPSRVQGGWSLGESARVFFSVHLPVILGVRDVVGPPFLPWPLSLLMPVVAVAAVLIVTVNRWRGLGALALRLSSRGAHGGEILLVFVLVAGGLVLSGGFLQVPRYLVPLYPALALLTGGALSMVAGRLRPVSLLAGLSVTAVLLHANWSVATVFHLPALRAYRDGRATDEALFAFLRSHALRYVYAPDYWVSVRLTFDAGESPIFAQPFDDHHPAYTAAVDAAPRSAYLFRGEAPAFEAGLGLLRARWQKSRVGPYVVYYDFQGEGGAQAPLPASLLAVTARPESALARLAVDRNLFTRWTSDGPQRPGITLEVTLPEPETVAGVALLPGLFASDSPRSLEVHVSEDGVQWRRLATLPERAVVGLTWDGAPRMEPTGRIQMAFPPTRARAIRMIQSGSDPRHLWSIAELFVYRAGNGGGPAPEVQEALARGRRLERAGDWRQAAQAYLLAMEAARDWEEPYAGLVRVLPRLQITDGVPLEEAAARLEALGLWPLVVQAHRRLLATLPGEVARSWPMEALARASQAMGQEGEAEQWRREAARAFSPERPVGALFSGRIRLEGVNLEPAEVRAGEAVRVTYYWSALGVIKEPYAAFVHFGKGGAMFGNDHWPLGGVLLTDRWRPGERYRETYTVTIPPTTPPGVYPIRVGLWRPESGTRLRLSRWPLPFGADRVIAGELTIRGAKR